MNLGGRTPGMMGGRRLEWGISVGGGKPEGGMLPGADGGG